MSQAIINYGQSIDKTERVSVGRCQGFGLLITRALGCYLVTSRVSDDLFRAAVSQGRFLFLLEASGC